MSDRSRGWCFTLNNWSEEEFERVRKIECRYMIVGEEVGKEGTPHLQGFIYYDNARTWKELKDCLPRAHIEKCKGNAMQNIEYCSKECNFFEKGDRPKQGKRTDLSKIKDDIISGKKVDDIVLENPIVYHQYGRTLNKIEDLRMRNVYRTEMTEGLWYFGETNVGKSHRAFEGYDPKTFYNVPKDNGWWDGYTQQDIVIFNDFRGEVNYNDMLNIVDKWPYSVRRRNREPLPFISKKVIITSSLPPWKVYRHREEEDKLEQLLRRFKVYEVRTDGCTEVVGGNTSPAQDLDEYRDIFGL